MRKLITTTFHPPTRTMLSFFATFSLAVAFLFQANFANAQVAPTDLTNCYGTCKSNDFTVLDIFLSKEVITGGVTTYERVVESDCASATDVETYLSFTFRNNTSSDRNGVFVSGSVNGVFYAFCFPGVVLTGQVVTYTANTTPITWTCGTSLLLENTFVGWGSSGEAVCGNDCDQNKPTPSKCRTLGDFFVNTPLTPNFSFVANCVSNNAFETVAFTNETSGATHHYYFSWDFGDGSAISHLENPSHTYTSAGNFDVQLTVKDTLWKLDDEGDPIRTDPPISITTKDITHTVAVASCCDNIPPVISPSGTTTTLGCNPSTESINAALGSATASDAGDNSTVTAAPSTGEISSDGCSRSQTRTWTAIDACGNSSTAARTVTWIADNTGPTLTTGGGSLTLGCNPSAGDINASLGTATATDACGVPTVSSNDGSVRSDGCNRTQTRTFTAIDACTNTSTAARTVTWTADNTAPELTTGGTGTSLGCNPSTEDINGALGTATATDFCGVPTVTPSDGSVSSDGCSRSQTRTFTAEDACGKTSTASRTVTWTADVTAPVLTTGGTGTTLGCNPSAGDINGALGTATATDACGVPTVSSSDGDVTSDGCSRSQTRTWTARDACNKTSTASRTVTWTADVTAPVLTTGGTTTTLGCNPSAGDINGALGTATATDACGVPTVSSSDGDVTSDGCSRSQTRTWTARDACRNTSTASRTVTWTADVTAPVLTTGGESLTLGCNPSAGDINGALGTATATDACGVPTVSSRDGDVTSDGCSRSQTRTWTARDACNKTSTASRTVTWTADATAPVLTTGGTTTTLGCNPSAGDINGALGTATATDACGVPTVSSSDGDVTSDGCSRSKTRTWTARDACRNTSTASRTVTWTADVTAPVLTTGGESLTLGCNPSAGDINGALGTATATDACGVPTVSSRDGDVTSDGCSRSQTRTWTARDVCRNTSSAARTVTWTADVTAPVLTTGGTGTSLGCNPSAGDINGALGTATATDACGVPTVSSRDGDVTSDGCSRSQTRTWTARDACRNTSTAARTVTWTADNTDPVLTTGGTGTTLGCNPSAGDINGALGTATATDACGVPTVSSRDGDVTSDGCSRSQTRTWTARDACRNTSTASRTVTWTADVIPPVLTTGGTGTSLGCNPSAGDINGALGTATATDACGVPTVSSSDGGVTSDGCSRSQTRTWTARDFCGNTSTAARTATWTADYTRPVLTTGGTGTSLGCNPSAATINGALGTATATDACGVPTVSSSDGSVGSDGCNRSQTRTWTARDFCGNTSTASRTVTWIADLTRPVFINDYSNITLGCSPSASEIETALGSASATDACSTPTVSILSTSAVSGTGGCRIQTRTFKAIDGCNNTATVSRRVNWTVPLTDGCWTISLRSVTAVGANTKYLFEICGNGCPNALSNVAFLTGNRSVISPANLSTYNYPGAPDINYTVVVPVARNVNGVKFETFVGVEGIKNGCDFFEFTVEGAPIQITVQIKAGKAKANSVVIDPNCVCSQAQNLLTRASVRSELTKEVVSTATVTAYPNPFSDQVMFRILSPVSGRAILETYDFLGRKMAVIYQGNVEAGVQRTVTYKIPATQRVPMIYTLRVGDRMINGKLFPNGAMH